MKFSPLLLLLGLLCPLAALHADPVDTTPPTITSIVRQIPAAQVMRTNLVIFEVTFSEAVTNVSTNTFVLTRINGGTTTGNITAVSGGPSVYQVAVAVTGGAGDFRLDVGPLVSTFATGFSNPNALVFDPAGNLYVADSGNSTVRKITTNGVVSTLATGISSPNGIALSAAGDLYVTSGSEVKKVTSAGVVSTFATGFSVAAGLAFDGEGNLLVGNYGNHTISKVTTNGVTSLFASSMNAPFGLTFDSLGNLYVAHRDTGNISRVTPGGTVSLYASGMNGPHEMEFDAAGNLYVADRFNNRVVRVDTNGTVNPFVVSLSAPFGMARDSSGALYVSSYITGNLVSKITLPIINDESGNAVPELPYQTGATYTYDPNDAPTNIQFSVTWVSAPAASGAVLGTFSTVDPDLADTHTYTLVSGVGDTNNASFVIDGNTLRVGGATLGHGRYSLRIRTADGQGGTFETAFSLAVVDGTVPQITSVSRQLPADQTTTTNTVVFAVTFSEAVTGVGTNRFTVTPVNGGTVSGAVTAVTGGPTNYSVVVALTGGLGDFRLDVVAPPAPTNFVSGLNNPWGLAFDSTGRIYVANGGDGTVRRLTNGVLGTFATGMTTARGLAFDSAGNLYVGSSSLSRVSKVTSAGVLTTFVSSTTRAHGLAFDGAGNLFVAGNSVNQIYKVTPAASRSTFASGVNAPMGVAFDSNGDLYVANNASNTVSRITPGGVASIFASGLSAPAGLAFDSAGILYVANSTNNTVSRVAPNGVVSTFATGFNLPAGLVFDSEGNLCVANYAGNTISKVSREINDLGGNAVPGLPYTSGNLYTYRLNATPTDLALDHDSAVLSAGADVVIGFLATTDADAGDTHSYAFATGAGDTDNASFVLETNALKMGPLALPAGTYSVRLQTDDGQGGVYAEAFGITVVDDVPPTLTLSAPSVSATAGGPVTFTVTYSGQDSISLAALDVTLNPTGTAGASSIGVTGTGNTRTITLSSLTGNGTLGISLAAGTAADTAGNLTAAAGPSATFALDQIAPAIVNITGVTNGTYGEGDVLDFVVNFSEPVTLTGTGSTLGLTLDTNSQAAAFVANTASNITYRYTVQNGDSAPIGIYVGVIALNGSTIADEAGNAATLAQAASADFFRSNLVSTGLSFPVGLVIDPASGNLSVADVNNNTIRTYASNGTQVASFNTGLNKPYGFTRDADGNFLVANTFANRVDEFNSAGVFVRTITPIGTTGFNRPFSLALATNGNLVVADYNNSRVQVLQRDGTWVRTIGTGVLGRVTGVLVDAANRIIVTDAVNGRLVEFEGDGTFVRTLASGLNNPYGLARDAAGNILVANNGNFTLGVYTRSGLFQRSINLVDPFPNALGGVAVDAAGNVLLASSEDRRVEVWSRLFPVTAFVDTTPPTIVSVTPPTNGTYTLGQTLSFTVIYDRAVTVTGEPQLALTLGATARAATYTTNGGTATTLVFTYTLQAGDEDFDGITVTSPLTLNGGSIQKGLTAASLVFTAPNTTGVLADTVAPTLVSTTPADEATGVAIEANLVLTFSENVVRGTGNITLDAASGADVLIDVTDTDQVTITGSTVTINPSAALGFGTSYDVIIPATVFQDAAGNFFAGLTTPGDLNFTTEVAPPVLTGLNGDSVSWAGPGGAVTLDDGSDATPSEVVFEALYAGRGNWSGATLTVQRINATGTPMGTAGDVISLANSEIFHADTGADPFNGYPVGNIQPGQNATGALFGPPDDNGNNWFARYFYTSATGTLVIRFGPVSGDGDINAIPTTALVQEVIRHVAYRNDTPAGDALLRFTLDNGSATVVADVTVMSDSIYVNNTADTATVDLSDGVSFSEAVAIAAADVTGSPVLILSSAFGAGTTLVGDLAIGKDLTINASAVNSLGSAQTLAGSQITIASNITVTMVNTTGVTANIGSTLAGPGTLAKTGSGVLRLTSTGNEANMSGGILVAGGTLEITDDNQLPAGTLTLDGAVLASNGGPGVTTTIDNAVTLGAGGGTFQIFGGSGTFTLHLTGVVSGNGNLTKTTAAILRLSGDNTYTGTTAVQAGVLVAAHDHALGTTAGGTTVGDGAVLQVASGVTVGDALSLSGTGRTVSGVDYAPLHLLGGSGTVNGEITLASDADIGAVSGATLTLNGVISGSGNLNKTGAGRLVLAGANTFTGTTTISVGDLTLAGGSAVADAGAVTVAADTTLTLAASESLGSLSGAGSVALGTNTLSAGGDNTSTTFAGAITGNGAVIKTGSGTLTLAGENSYLGNTTVAAGQLAISSDSNLGAGIVALQSGTTLEFLASTTVDNDLTFSGNASVGVGSGRTVTLSGAASGAGGITKTGSGTLVLGNANNLQAGSTTVAEGKLQVDGAILGTGAVTVNAGTVLGGNGSLAGAVTVDGDGTLSPGASPGTLTVTNLTLSSGATLFAEINGTVPGVEYDRVAVSGSVNLNLATLSLSVGFTPAVGDSFLLIANDGTDPVVGTFGGLPEGSTIQVGGSVFRISYAGGTGNDVTLTVPDITAPVISSVSGPASGLFRQGGLLDFTVTFDEPVVVNSTGGNPYLSLTVGTNAVPAGYISGSGSSNLVFRYVVGAGDLDADGVTAVSPLVLNAGTIRDLGENDATLTFTAPDTSGVLVDGIAPTIVSINRLLPSAEAVQTTSVVFEVTFSEDVQGVRLASFAVTPVSGSTIVGTVTSVSGGPKVYEVAVDIISGTGAFRLDGVGH